MAPAKLKGKERAKGLFGLADQKVGLMAISISGRYRNGRPWSPDLRGQFASRNISGISRVLNKFMLQSQMQSADMMNRLDPKRLLNEMNADCRVS